MKKKQKKEFLRKWKLNPNEKCPKDTKGNIKNVTCFVPTCGNHMWRQGIKNRRLLFFKVPSGIKGLLWTQAIRKMARKTFQKCMEKLSRGESTEFFSRRNIRYCCEAHFDIRRDIERIVKADGSIEFNVKPDVFPSVEHKQKDRLIHIFKSDALLENCRGEYKMKNEIVNAPSIKQEDAMETDNSNESTNDVSTNGLPSIVDIFTLNEESKEHQPNVYYEIRTLNERQTNDTAMLPLTIALMKRKPLHYMGLPPELFSHFMKLANEQTKLLEMKLMLTLRKYRLKEDFETLGDVFDLHKRTARQYFNESKGIVAKLFGTVTGCTATGIETIATTTTITTVHVRPEIEVNGFVEEIDSLDVRNETLAGVDGRRKRKFVCNICDMKYSLRSSLDEHVQQRHSDESQFLKLKSESMIVSQI